MRYNHTQIGYLMIVITILIAGLFGFILIQAGVIIAMLLIMIFILFILVSFSTLNVSIDEENLKIRFGYGIYKKSFKLNEIASSKIVRNHWYFGWGIRFWFWPPTWIYNVSGFDAVELKMKDGSRFRIGTDEPEKLENSILQSINWKGVAQ